MKPMWMMLIGIALFSGFTAHGKEKCSNATLNGSYGFYASGTIIGVGPVALVGVVTFDGKGGLSGTVTENINGNNVQFPFTGTYAVDASCRVSDTNVAPNGQMVTNELVIVDGGKEFYVLNTTPGNVIFGVGKKQFPDDDGGDDRPSR